MASFEKIVLEFVRPGPSHNQLLSPLTSYMALCGDSQPVTLHIPIEHHKLLNRIRSLRYMIKNGSTGVTIPDPIRESQVVELGEEVASIFSNIQTLNSEISRAQGKVLGAIPDKDGSLVHLRLVLSGSELSLIPFELAISPQAFPGEGLEFCLQGDMSIAMTREIRRHRPAPIPWDRAIEPRILFISAEPAGMTVPKKSHIHALRQAMEPWIHWPHKNDKNTDRTAFIKERLRLLINPSINDIYNHCSKNQYTHIHILAHGVAYKKAGEQRFGLALCQQHDKNQIEVVSGKKIAKALQAKFTDSLGRSQPLMVTLATCDSGNTGSLLIPGGSIAYDLHAEGIPWVFASQFPLTKKGSVKMTETLYPRILRGMDPRQVLYEVRRQLYMTSEMDHDWASMTVFASMPDDAVSFQEQVDNFFKRQMRRAIEVFFDRADNGKVSDIKTVLDNVTTLLNNWEHQLPTGNLTDDRIRRAECYGLHGSAYKRIALLSYSSSKKNETVDAKKILATSLSYYKKSMDEIVFDNSRYYYWVATQYLSLSAVINPTQSNKDTYRFVKNLVEEDLNELKGDDLAWAYATMAELELLYLFHDNIDKEAILETTKENVLKNCVKVINLKGAQSFHATSTARQFKRYIDHWLTDKDKAGWLSIAEEAYNKLAPESLDNEEFPDY